MATKTTREPVNTEPVMTHDEWAIDAKKIVEETSPGPSYWRPKEGDNLIRILPLRGQNTFFIQGAQHWVQTADKKIPVFCPLAGSAGRCFFCEQVMTLRKSGHTEDEADAAELKPRSQYFVAMVDLKEVDKGVQVFSFGTMIMRQLTTIITLPDYGNIFHPRTGRDISIKKTNKGGGPKNVEYVVVAGGREKPITNMAWLDEVSPLLSKVIEYKSYTEQQALVTFQPSTNTDEDDEDSVRPVASGRLTAGTVECDDCGAVIRASALTCPECGINRQDEDAAPPVASPMRASLSARLSGLRA